MIIDCISYPNPCIPATVAMDTDLSTLSEAQLASFKLLESGAKVTLWISEILPVNKNIVSI